MAQLRRFTQGQIIDLLQEAERQDQSIVSLCRANGITPSTFYRWRREHGGLSASQVQKLHELQQENRRLNQLAVRLQLEVIALKEAQDL